MFVILYLFFPFFVGGQVESRKTHCWKKAVDILRAAGGPQIRKWKDIRKKWNELKVQAHKYSDQRNVTGKSNTSKSVIYQFVICCISLHCWYVLTCLLQHETLAYVPNLILGLKFQFKLCCNFLNTAFVLMWRKRIKPLFIWYRRRTHSCNKWLHGTSVGCPAPPIQVQYSRTSIWNWPTVWWKYSGGMIMWSIAKISDNYNFIL